MATVGHIATARNARARSVMMYGFIVGVLLGVITAVIARALRSCVTAG